MLRRILIPLKSLDDETRALGLARALAERGNLELLVVQVPSWDPSAPAGFLRGDRGIRPRRSPGWHGNPGAASGCSAPSPSPHRVSRHVLKPKARP